MVKKVSFLSGKCRILAKSTTFINQYILLQNYDKIFLQNNDSMKKLITILCIDMLFNICLVLLSQRLAKKNVL